MEFKCDVVQKNSIHLLPCNIKYSGPANVSSYFCPQKSDLGSLDQEEWFDARFRGRQLTGSSIALPDTATGIVFQLNQKPIQRKTSVPSSSEKSTSPSSLSSESVVELQASQKFDHIMIWNKDLNQVDENNLKLMLTEWPSLAKAVHDPL